MSQPLILTGVSERVMVITMNRPEVRNALCRDLISQLNQSLSEAESNADIGVIVLTGGEKAFAAGADIREMTDLTFAQIYNNDFIALWEYLARRRKPVIAAVSGYALGGGCELAMMCDMILASDTAQSGQPEITLGTLPGAGGAQGLCASLVKQKPWNYASQGG